MPNEKDEPKTAEKVDEANSVNDFDLLNEVKKLKETTVSKEEYDKVVAEKKKLMKDFIYGSGDSTEVVEAKPNIQELRKKVLGDDVEKMSDLDFWKGVSDLYHARLEEGVNIFLPQGEKTKYTRDDYENVESFMETIDNIIEDSEDNQALFHTIFSQALS